MFNRSLFPCGYSMVAMIDDRTDVWGDAANLVKVQPYTFFDGTTDINAPSGADRPAGCQLRSRGPTQRRSRVLHVPVRNKSRKYGNEEENQGISLSDLTCNKQTSLTARTISEFQDPGLEYQEMIEWEDSDKHLIHLEDILERVHKTYYDRYEQAMQQCSTTPTPDLRSSKRSARSKHSVYWNPHGQSDTGNKPGL